MSCASSGSFAVEPDGAAKNGDCLSGPKGAAPQGERWYYRVERNTKRHCWYTRAGSPRNVAARTPAPAPEPSQMAEETAATLQPSIANARAEAATPAPPPLPAIVTPPVPAASGADAPKRTLADRFSDHPDAAQPAQPLPASSSRPTPQAASTKAPADQGTPFGLLLMMIGGTLALVGVAVASIKRFAQPPIKNRSGDLWPRAQQHADDAEPSPPLSREDDEPSMTWDGPPMNWVRIAREEADRRDDEIQQLLSRPARPAM